LLRPPARTPTRPRRASRSSESVVYMKVGEADSGLLPIPDINYKDVSGYRLIPLSPNESAVAHQAYGDVIPGEWALAQFIALKSGGFIHLHTDPPTDETKGRTRYHVVLQTNPYCWNYHDGSIQ